MDKATIRPPQAPAATSPVARNAGARQAAGSEAPGGFSLLLADMAAPGADLPLALLPGQEPAPLVGLAESGLLSLASLVGQTARMDGAADAAQRDGRGLAAGKSEGEGARRSAALPMGAGQPAAASQAFAWTASAARGTAVAESDTDAAPAQGLADPSTLAAAQSSLPSLAPSGRGAQPHALAALLAQMEPTPQASAGTLAPAAPPGLAGAGAAPGHGAASALGAGSADSFATAAADTAPVQADAAAPDAVLSLPDDAWTEQLSEQVAFWVQQKTQRAELTIDRQGRPVQVQVAITGNEAHVSFRSDEQQTRDMLDASTAQLREMLAQQGLTLAGVTVQAGNAGGQGASARQDASGRSAPRDAENPRQTAQVAVDLRARPDARRAVDLFV